MSSAVVPPRAASEALTPDPASVARFGADLAALAPAGRVLVAVSGGPDSVALLLLMRALDPARCVAATVDHGLRAEGAAEAAWVADLCGRLGIGHAVLSAPLPARAGRTRNVQSRARALRYALLEAHRDTIGADWLATAHHADDQVETMVMRLDRGAGIGGLAGIRARRGPIVRPLLGWRRAELAAIVASAGIEARDDPSNRDDRFARARLRKSLAGAGWIDAARWSRSAGALADADAALDWAAGELAGRWVRAEGDGAVTLTFGDCPAEIRRRLVTDCLTRVDPGIAPRGPDLDRLIASIGAGRRATLGRVMVSAGPTDADPRTVRFTLAPPRRSG